jgi:hypothetical protein
MVQHCGTAGGGNNLHAAAVSNKASKCAQEPKIHPTLSFGKTSTDSKNLRKGWCPGSSWILTAVTYMFIMD